MLQAVEKEPYSAANKTRLLKLKSLQQAAQKLSDLKSKSPNLSTKDLVGVLICQVQRNKRVSLSRVRIHLRFSSYSNVAAVKLRLGASNF